MKPSGWIKKLFSSSSSDTIKVRATSISFDENGNPALSKPEIKEISMSETFSHVTENTLPAKEYWFLRDNIKTLTLRQRLGAIGKLSTMNLFKDFFKSGGKRNRDYKLLSDLLSSLKPPGPYQEWLKEKNKAFTEALKNDRDITDGCNRWRQGLCDHDQCIGIVMRTLSLHRKIFSDNDIAFRTMPVMWDSGLEENDGGIYKKLDRKNPSLDQPNSKIGLLFTENGKLLSPFNVIGGAIHEQTHAFQDQLAHARYWNTIPRAHPAFKGAQFFHILARKTPYLLPSADLSSYLAQATEDEAYCQELRARVTLYLQSGHPALRIPLRYSQNVAKAITGLLKNRPAP